MAKCIIVGTASAIANGSISYPALSGHEELNRTFYDNYTWLGNYGNPLAATYNNTFDSYFQAVAPATWPYPQANVKSDQIRGMVTGSRTKVLGTANTYLYTVSFYNEKGRVIQLQSTNITGGTDIVTTQYTWAGLPFTIVQKQDKPGINPQNQIIVTKMQYDDLGKGAEVKKSVNSTINAASVTKPEQFIVQNEYDQFGAIKEKNTWK